ncbi:hypothetical protein RHGRI_025367 [Rhododendron griersonianum]|uniref:Uncharacterized protein n=1 Tax=Rhododendron griersonianum TaxID=479676 RepID=A0AAV6ISD5_9ERIC|nr:hypothetical protein RHGRI_025367 [Rhododendron griersonianum]
MIVRSNSRNLRMRICEKIEFKESDDVYAFGILLVEVTGENPEEVSNLCEGFDGTSIGGNLCDAIDSSLIGKGFDGEISQFLKVHGTLLCQFQTNRMVLIVQGYCLLMLVLLLPFDAGAATV